MDKFLPSINKKSRRKFKHCKPFLGTWIYLNNGRKCIQLLLNSVKVIKGTYPLRTRLKSIYRFTSVNLIKMLRSKECSFNKSPIDKLEQINMDNHTELWNHIKKLGPRKEADIPFCCKDRGWNNNQLLCNPKFINKNNRYFGLSSIYFLYPLASLPKMVKQEMPASVEQS